jgi:hypothetical protein
MLDGLIPHKFPYMVCLCVFLLFIFVQVLLKGLVLYVNYLQTVHAVQAVSRAARRRQQKYPPFPLF